MIRFFRLYLRKFRSNLQYYNIITVGLGLALTAALFIFNFVSHEYSYNKSVPKCKDIYRVLEYSKGSASYRSDTFDPLSKLLKEKSPYVAEAIRYHGSRYEFDVNSEIFAEDGILTDPSFFSIFDVQVISGSVAKFENTPESAFISESLANKYFGSENPEGKIIAYSRQPMQAKDKLEVVGVFKDLPENSTITGNIVINMAVEDQKKEYADWQYINETYVLIPEKNNVKSVENSIVSILKPALDADGLGNWIKEDGFKLQRFDRIYLYSKNVEDFTVKGNLTLLKILIVVGLLILLMSVFNFFAIHSGLLIKRLGNFQTMKCFGASPKNIMREIVRENIASISICAILSIVLFLIINPSVQRYLGINSFDLPFIRLLSFVVFLLILAVSSGILQYLFFKKVARNKIKTFDFSYRKVLTVVQLTAFLLIISSLFVISRQVSFMKNTDLGFDMENTVSIMPYGAENGEYLLMNLFSNKSYVKSASFGWSIYNEKSNASTVKVGDEQSEIQSIIKLGDRNYINTFELTLVEGRNINTEFVSGNSEQRSKTITEILVNEQFVQEAGLENPVGTIITNNQMIGEIVGVIKNVYQSAFFEPIKPMIIGNIPFRQTYLVLNLAKGSFPDFYTDYKAYCESIGMGDYTEYLYTKEDASQVFAKEITLIKLFKISFVIAFIILSLGLFAMNLFIVESKTKEIGIRKVNGANVSEILSMLNKDFIKWVVIAFVIATPIAYYAMNKWLENFAYKTTLSWWIFALAGVLALGIALLTVSWQSWRAATRNPVEALRYE
ncbi:FtsX-like permease family protein [Draconibacterium sp. IB214405]|uniref:FtsX-like permease family protein n=1 Tax=Draconibacterium sp. IB214405 TaxID=3097352 RepID=UPI002A0B285E|nr:FtsX-like permease family protein [Draconibacterium sp. IB214405]MDX8337737.1 FtsX-like permease family protein [Draconibacterium sp. IB214405]